MTSLTSPPVSNSGKSQDLSRFGSEVFRSSPRQADLMNRSRYETVSPYILGLTCPNPCQKACRHALVEEDKEVADWRDTNYHFLERCSCLYSSTIYLCTMVKMLHIFIGEDRLKRSAV